VISGARSGQPGGLLRLIGRALPPRLDALVLPGLDIARAHVLDIEAAGLRPVATPRHATVLLIVGELPDALLEAAAAVYAQLPRPRAVVALGAGGVSPLPADVVAGLSQEGLEVGVERVRELLREGAWSAGMQPFEADVLLPKRRKSKKKPSSRGRSTSGSGGGHDEHANMTHDDKGAGGGGMDHRRNKGGGMSGAMAGGGGMGHGGMGGMKMGFMSMVRLTQHLQRSADGLPMERVEAPFGPFFPGLPSGLGLTLWLDGDTVARVEVAGLGSSATEQLLTGDLAELSDRMARADPLAPASYRLLARLALGNDQSEQPGDPPRSPNDDGRKEARRRMADERQQAGPSAPEALIEVEFERIVSHLNWLAGFGHLLGYSWLSRNAAGWQLALRRGSNRNDVLDTVASLEPKVLGFLDRVQRAPLLGARLRGIGRLIPDQLEGASGPVARACGLELDARLHDPLYTSLGFQPAVREDGDARDRLTVRLEEIRVSLGLVRTMARTGGRESAAPGARDQSRPAARTGGGDGRAPGADDQRARDQSRPAALSSHGADGLSQASSEASVETPRGTARLALRRSGPASAEVSLETPSAAALWLVEAVAPGLELTDALVAIASLDISPWAEYL
jgi:Ni,Fe-hydrogenase III large subunit